MKTAIDPSRDSPSAQVTAPARRRTAGRTVVGAGGVPRERVSARERLLAAADELFYEGGVHTVGIDRVIERAGVAKASLYNTFGSKDELVRAYLETRHAGTTTTVLRAVGQHDEPRERLLAVFDAQRQMFSRPGSHRSALA